MKRLVAIMFLILPVILLGNIVRGGPGERIMGFAPNDTLIDTIFVTVRVPARIGLYVNGNTEFDLGAVGVVFPPAVYPGYYNPTLVGGTNADGVNVEVFSNASTNWFLQTNGSGNFTATIALDQLYYAPDGEADPPDGTDPPGGAWTSFTTTYTTVTTGPKTTGWQSEDQDYIFQAETDDDPTAGATIVVRYRLYVP